MLRQGEYIWLDGAKPSQKLRSKTRILPDRDHKLEDLPTWGYDGSSTFQADGEDSDLVLKPVHLVHDPIRGEGNYLVLCEVNNPDGTPHSSNSRAHLRGLLDKGASKSEPWFGFEQEYTLMHNGRPLGWPEGGYPAPQGPFYCGVGSDEVFGRELVEEHTLACLEAGIMLFGINAEVMPGQWEFQVGYRGMEGETADPLTVCDHLVLARWLLFRLGEEHNIAATLDPKPVKGDWNGAGKHTNFSTKEMRDKSTGMSAIENAIKRLGERHAEHIKVYGHGLAERLTGLHETCSITDFRSGVADRGASIRIPRHVADDGYGYLEDRRPGANADPYEVAHILLETVCELA